MCISERVAACSHDVWLLIEYYCKVILLWILLKDVSSVYCTLWNNLSEISFAQKTRLSFLYIYSPPSSWPVCTIEVGQQFTWALAYIRFAVTDNCNTKWSLPLTFNLSIITYYIMLLLSIRTVSAAFWVWVTLWATICAEFADILTKSKVCWIFYQ